MFYFSVEAFNDLAGYQINGILKWEILKNISVSTEII